MEATTSNKGSGRGSLASPERTYENVPGHVIPILEEELQDFETQATRFLRGELDPDRFLARRLKQGVYGQRQADVHMVRVKLPFGGVTPEQLDVLGDVAERWAPLGKGHITTRQNVQFHHVPLVHATELLQFIGRVGLSTREACGNTVRNVTGDPWAGVCPDEPFDITPYAAAFVRYFVRNPVCQDMPRKFKVSFSASDDDRAVSLIHDLGFIPRVRDGVRGVEVRTGGGTSIMARLGGTLYDFVPLDNGDYLKVSEAIMRIFDRQEWLRKNRARARLKFLVDKVGIEEFRAMVEEELRGEWVAERNFDPHPLLLLHDEEANAPAPRASYASPNGDAPQFQRFLEANVRPQRQAGFCTVEVKVPRGDLTPAQFRGLAQIMREYTGGYARTSIQQNLVLRWVREEAVYEVWQRLCELGLGDAGAHEVTDVVSCPGTDSCKLGITASMGLNRAVQERVEQLAIADPLTRRVHIKISGCPNGCGQHHLGTIGFYGASLKVGDKQLPAYVAHVGGRYEHGETAFGQRLKVRLPAKRVPDAVERWLRLYEREREPGETFARFVDRVGTKPFEDAVRDLALPVDFNLENLAMFIDWNRREPFKVVRGEGECAAG